MELATPSKSTDRIDPRPGYIVTIKAPQLELERLRKQQAKARADEVFGGLTTEERAVYERRQRRLRELERELPEPEELEPEKEDRPSLDLASRNR